MAVAAGVQAWTTQQVERLRKDGRTAEGAAMGPMAEVVFGSTRHLADADLHAMATQPQSKSNSSPRKPSRFFFL